MRRDAATVPFVAVAHHEASGAWALPAEASTAPGNARSIGLQILSRLPPPELELQQRSFSYGDGHTFRIATQGAVATLCLERGLGSAASFEMLANVRKTWRDSPAGTCCDDALEHLVLDAIAEHSRQSAFSSADEELGQVIHQKVQHVRTVLEDSIDKVLERGEKIDSLIQKSENLDTQAFKFHTSSRTLKRTLRWRNAKCQIMTCAALTGFLVLCVLYSCGFALEECRTADVSNLAHPALAGGAGWKTV